MGQITELARQRFTSMLRPGEGLEAMGIGIYRLSQSPTYALFGLTNQRLLVIECPADAWACAPKPEVISSLEFELAQLTQVRVEAGSNMLGALTRFVVVGPQGEITFILRPEYRQFGNKWNFGGFDAQQHQEFNQLVPEWLARQVAMGTPRGPQGVNHAIGELRAARANRAAFMAHSAQQAAQAAAAREAAASIMWPYALMGGAGLGASSASSSRSAG